MRRTIPLLALTIMAMLSDTVFSGEITKYVRYQHKGNISYGILDGKTIHQLRGDIFKLPQKTGNQIPMEQVLLMPPTDPEKVIAVGLNYKSHITDRDPPADPALFIKLPTSLITDEAEITYFADADNLHFEGEMVLIVGRTATNISAEEASRYIFAVAPGNDVTERNWQRDDVQWFRGKAADTFAPVGPVMVSGVDYTNLLLQTRLNGEVKQSQRTKDLLFSPDQLVSYISKYVTLEPGDMIFTGTPGKTSAMRPGDVVEVELEQVGVLRNTVGPKQKK